MKVVLTRTAEACLWTIWNHDRLYSEALAEAFQRDIDRFIRDAIAANPEIGHLWHAIPGGHFQRMHGDDVNPHSYEHNLVNPTVVEEMERIPEGDGVSLVINGESLGYALSPRLEKTFLEDMIVHHQGAVDMSRELLKGTTRPELVQFANDIITLQSKEIEMQKQWLSEWY